MTDAKPYSASELLEIAQKEHGPLDIKRVLATYADASNWAQVYEASKSSRGYKPRACEWAFICPMRPGYELAEMALKQLP